METKIKINNFYNVSRRIPVVVIINLQFHKPKNVQHLIGRLGISCHDWIHEGFRIRMIQRHKVSLICHFLQKHTESDHWSVGWLILTGIDKLKFNVFRSFLFEKWVWMSVWINTFGKYTKYEKGMLESPQANKSFRMHIAGIGLSFSTPSLFSAHWSNWRNYY